MRVCRTELRAAVRPAATLAALFLLTGQAAAQLGAPVPLLRPAARPAPADTDVAKPLPPPNDDIKAVPLAPLDGAWAGPLDARNGGFPGTMWKDTQRPVVAALLPMLAPSTSPTLQDLARRLLLSNADAPAGPDQPDRPSLVAARLHKLLALGIVAGTEPLLNDLPRSADAEAVARAAIELRFAGGDRTAACRAVDDGVARYQGHWWDRALVACQALTGDNAAAALGLGLLAEQKAPGDPAFTALIETLGGHAHKIERLPDPDPLTMALLAAAKLPLPPDALASASPSALRAYAVGTDAPAELRLAAAERAALLGALSPDTLDKLYQQAATKPEDRATALKEDQLPDDPQSRAAVYMMARSVIPGATRGAAMAALLAESKKRGAFFLTARLLAPYLLELQADGQPPAFAADAARVLLATGRVAAAGPWIAASDAGKELLAVSRLAAPGSGGETILRDAVAALAGRDSASAPAQAGMLVGLYAALDMTPGQLDWAPLLGPPHAASLPSAALWADQIAAASGNRLGETVLATLLIAPSGNLLSPEPIVVGRAVAGLKTAGLLPEARALAVEAALAAGL